MCLPEEEAQEALDRHEPHEDGDFKLSSSSMDSFKFQVLGLFPRKFLNIFRTCNLDAADFASVSQGDSLTEAPAFCLVPHPDA